VLVLDESIAPTSFDYEYEHRCAEHENRSIRGPLPCGAVFWGFCCRAASGAAAPRRILLDATTRGLVSTELMGTGGNGFPGLGVGGPPA
jgi:hypothetical protein